MIKYEKVALVIYALLILPFVLEQLSYWGYCSELIPRVLSILCFFASIFMSFVWIIWWRSIGHRPHLTWYPLLLIALVELLDLIYNLFVWD